MKPISRPLLYFALAFVILSFIFRYGLSTFLSKELYAHVVIIAILYGVSLFTAGWVFGKAQGLKSLKFDIGISFHLTGYLAWSLSSLIWFWMGLNSEHENIETVYRTMAIWGVFLAVHFIVFLFVRRNTIKGIHKSDIFD